MIATLARFLFVPAFYLTAKYGDQGWIMLTSVLGLTNGYLSVCGQWHRAVIWSVEYLSTWWVKNAPDTYLPG